MDRWINERLCRWISLPPPAWFARFCFSNDLLSLLAALGLAPFQVRSSSIQNQAILCSFSRISTHFRADRILIRDQISSLQRGISIIFFQMYIQGQSSHKDPGKNKPKTKTKKQTQSQNPKNNNNKKTPPLTSSQGRKLIPGRLSRKSEIWCYSSKNVSWIQCCFSMRSADLFSLAVWTLVFTVS